MAVLAVAVVLLKSASVPMAVFQMPVVLLKSACHPLAVLAPPVVLLWKRLNTRLCCCRRLC